MSAIKRTGVAWENEFLISAKQAYSSDYQHVASGDSTSGLEFCTVQAKQYFRYDCYDKTSPYGWHLVSEANAFEKPKLDAALAWIKEHVQ
jgi:hypothetical protein